MGAWQEIVDYTVPSNTTSVVLNDFGTITKDDFFKVAISISSSSTSFFVSCFPDTTDGVAGYNTGTNYHSQSCLGTGTIPDAFRANLNIFTNLAASSSYALGYLKLSENGKFNTFTNEFIRTDSLLFTSFRYTTSSNLTFNDPITSLTFTASVTNALGTGTRIQIYKLAAEKVADITVASNTTQVDISSLSIDKDSEYLLVSDISNGSGTDTQIALTVNDVTTGTSYYRQRIRGDGSSASALRANDARVFDLGTGVKGLAYSHIKLSNIGAATSQNYGIMQQGTSSIFLQNHFISSTSEAITSITKLNIVASATNGVGTDSRFILYKLYE